MTGRLAGRVALVSGGARGMGASHVRALASEGASVVFGDILDGDAGILNISSIEGLAGTIACHGYTATKFAVRGLTKSTSLELGPSGIRVNSIHPGLIKTPMTEWVPDDIFQTALGRAADPREVSNLVVYLASDESSYSTGSEFVVDGGCTAGLGHKDFSAVDADAQPEWVR